MRGHGAVSCARLLRGHPFLFSFLRRKLVTIQAEEGVALSFSVIKDPSCYGFCFSEALALHGCHHVAAAMQVGVACSLPV